MQEKYFNINTAGNSIRCKLYFADLKAVKRVVLCVHGFTGHKDNKAVERFADYVLKKHKPEQLFVYANSFGGYQILKYIAEHGDPFDKIALRCPAVNMYQSMAERIVKPEEQRALARNKPIEVGFDRKVRITRSFLEEVKAADITQWDFRPFAENILILHGTADEIVPYEAVRAFAEKNDIRFVSVENADHRFVDPLKMDLVIKHITELFGM